MADVLVLTALPDPDTGAAQVTAFRVTATDEAAAVAAIADELGSAKPQVVFTLPAGTLTKRTATPTVRTWTVS